MSLCRPAHWNGYFAARSVRGDIVTVAFMLGVGLTGRAASADPARLAADSSARVGYSSNLGSDASLVVGAGVSVPTAQTHASFLRFDLSDLPPSITGTEIARATLRLWVSSIGASGTLYVVPVLTPWSERTITGVTTPLLGASDVGVSIGANAAQSFISIDVTRHVRDWRDGMLVNNGL